MPSPHLPTEIPLPVMFLHYSPVSARWYFPKHATVPLSFFFFFFFSGRSLLNFNPPWPLLSFWQGERWRLNYRLKHLKTKAGIAPPLPLWCRQRCHPHQQLLLFEATQGSVLGPHFLTVVCPLRPPSSETTWPPSSLKFKSFLPPVGIKKSVILIGPHLIKTVV